MSERSRSWLYTACYIGILLVIRNVGSALAENATSTAAPVSSSTTPSTSTVVPASTTAASTPAPAPTRGAKIAAIEPLNSKALLVTWEAVSNGSSIAITGYSVCYQLTPNVSCANNKTVDGHTLNATLTGLNEATVYYVAVLATSASGNGPLGEEEKGTTDEDVPSNGPNITNITDVSSTGMTVIWNKLDDNDDAANGRITQYAVCYEKQEHSGNLANCVQNETTTNAVMMVSLKHLNEATNYVVAVKAATSKGFGKLGNSLMQKTLEDVPSKGPNITNVTDVSSTNMTIIWHKLDDNDDAANGDITQYAVCYEEQENVGSLTKCTRNETTSNNVTMVTLKGLNEATNYTVAVKAATSKGFGELGGFVLQKTREAKPATGPNITVITSDNSTSLKVKWDKLNPDDSNGIIVKYTVCYRIHQTSTSDNICSGNSKPEIEDVNNRETVLNGLMKATSYDVAVQAATAKGYGPPGQIETRSTLEDKPNKGPTLTKVIVINSTVLEVTWWKLNENDTNGNVTEYIICYQAQQSSGEICNKNIVVKATNNTMAYLTGLNEYTTYSITVQAVTSAGAGPNGNILNGTTLQDKPAKGPTITGVTADDSRSLLVNWKELSRDDANGIITNYTVCYKEGLSGENICTLNETVTSLTTRLYNLRPFTSYDIRIIAATKIGFGPLGDVFQKETLEGTPNPPRILVLSTDFTTISLQWFPPSHINGVLKKYLLCWHLTEPTSPTEQPCKEEGVSNTFPYRISNLQPGKSYTLSLSAYTNAGKGGTTSTTAITTASGLNKDTFRDVTTLAVNDDTTQIGFKLPRLTPSEAARISSYEVIVKRWTTSDDEDTFRETPQNMLTNYANSNGGEQAYITLTSNNYLSEDKIIIGNNSKKLVSARRKRNTEEYVNAPLAEDTQYAIFVRVFYGQDKTIFTSSGILVARTAEEDNGGSNVLVIVLVVIVLVIVILIAIFGVLLLRRHKARPNYNGIQLETTAKPVVRYPIPVAEFRAHCERLGINSGLGYQDEYESVRPKGPVSSEVAKRQENLDKNRYNNIHAYDDSRVILSQLDGEEGSDYINANHIDGFERKNQFIAAQGTLKNTIVDFWRMIWEQKVSSIVMLANPVEKGREKLAVYWPQDRAVKHGPFMIKLDGEVELADYVIRKMTVTKDDVKETRQLTQFHYTVWPDHGVPLYTTSLQAFLTRIRKSVKEDKNPVVVHCSAGVGRTGTFIGIFAMLDRIESTQSVDIFNFVCQMRTQRTHMVQVESQYVFLHKAVLEAIECGDTEINAPDLRVKMTHLNRADSENPDQTLMVKQFKVLEKYTFVKSNTEEGKKSYNVEKNRNKDLLPYEDTRVSLLKSPGVDGSDYINASCIDSYQVRGMYIATQFPLENTVNEFWRMIWEKKSNCIVMLANEGEQPDSFKKYWTDKSNDALLCGNLLVTSEHEEKHDEFIIRNFKLKKNDGGETRDVRHFEFSTWTEDKVPETTVGIRQMIGKIQDVQRQAGNNPITVHCSDGGGRTGAFCALVTSLERVKQDQSFNLFQTIMLQRIQRPRMVSSVDQYKFCFRAILDFLDSFDQYANFQDLRQ